MKSTPPSLEPAPPELLRHLKWLLLHGRAHWKLVLLAGALMALGPIYKFAPYFRSRIDTNGSRIKKASVVFDLTHEQSEWNYLEESMRRLLPKDALFIKEGDFLSYRKIIDHAQVLILALPYHQNFSLDEIHYVRDWVAKGGGLFLMVTMLPTGTMKTILAR